MQRFDGFRAGAQGGGVVPEGWTRRPLGEIARITSGGTPDRAEPSYWGGDIPWVTTGEIRFNTITDTTQMITAAGLKNSSAKLFPPGTLLMAMYGQGKTRGQVAKLGIEAATNQACAAINFHAGHDTDYFFHVLAWKYDLIRELGNAGTQQNLNAGIIKEIEVPVPESAEQRRIAQVLACWDQAIAVTVALLTNSGLQKDTLAAVLLSGKRRLLRESDWSKKSLSELIVESRVVGSGGDAARKLTVKLYGRGVVGKSDKRVGSASTNYYRRDRKSVV